MKTPTWYDDARLYELAFAFPADHELRFLRTFFERSGCRPPDLLLEPMCGTGRLIEGLSRMGFRVAGFDRSRAMLQRARKRAPDALLFQADAAAFETRRVFHGAFCLIDSFRYLLSKEAARGFFAGLSRALVDGGLFVLGLEVDEGRPPEPERWTTHAEGLEITTTLRNLPHPDPKLSVLEARIETRGPDGRRESVSRMEQRRWSPEDLETFLAALDDFSVECVHRRSQELGDPLPGLPPRGGPVVITLRRRESAHGPGGAGAGRSGRDRC